MNKGGLIFDLGILAVALLALKATLTYPFKSMIFPLIAIGIALIILIVQIIKGAMLREIKVDEGFKSDGYLNISIWLVVSPIMLVVLGFMATVILYPFLYLRFHGESWWLSLIIPVGSGAFFYGLFGWGLGMPLYTGWLLATMFG